MLETSQEYKDAVYGISRRVHGRVDFEILDVTASGDATATVTSELEISRKQDMFNRERQLKTKYATLENDFWRLDGSYTLPTNPISDEIGYISADLSGSDGVFATPQEVEINFTENHSSIGLTITFDGLNKEFATEFVIFVYDEFDSLIHQENVVGNTKVRYILEENLPEYRRIVVSFAKTNNPYRRIRIVEFDFGIVDEYEGDELIEFSLVEELDTISNTISPDEFKFTIENEDLRFDILNPDGIYPFLQRRQEIKPFLGVEVEGGDIEYIPLGIYYLINWKSNEGALTATFTARDLLDILEQSNFGGNVYSNVSLKAIAEEVLDDAGVEEYEIDNALDGVVTSGELESDTYKNTLQTICIAGQAVCYMNRFNVLVIERLGETGTGELIDFDNIYASPSIDLDKLVNTIVVEHQGNKLTYVDPEKPGREQTLAVEVENPLISSSQHAEDVAIWILGELKKRYLYEVRWRQNPALEVGDIVTLQTDYGNKLSRINKQEFEFRGYLAGKTYTKGGD